MNDDVHHIEVPVQTSEAEQKKTVFEAIYISSHYELEEQNVQRLNQKLLNNILLWNSDDIKESNSSNKKSNKSIKNFSSNLHHRLLKKSELLQTDCTITYFQ